MKSVFLLVLSSLCFGQAFMTLGHGEVEQLYYADGEEVTVSCEAKPNQGAKYLKMNNDQLYRAGLKGIGECKIIKSRRHCGTYVKVSGAGYPSGSGCASDKYSEYNMGPIINASLTLRDAIKARECF